MNDESRILRDIEEIPGEALREGRMRLLERDLGLPVLKGEHSAVEAARETRFRILNAIDNYPWRDPNIGAAVKNKLCRKGLGFWLETRESTDGCEAMFAAETVFLATALNLKPMEDDSSIHRDAREARNRILWELIGLDLYWDSSSYEKAVEDLKTKNAQFWHTHREFSAEELVRLHYPNLDGTFMAAVNRRKGEFVIGVSVLAFTLLSLLLPWIALLDDDTGPGLASGMFSCVCVSWGLGACAYGIYALYKSIFHSDYVKNLEARKTQARAKYIWRLLLRSGE